jgi:hypothetical protein
MVMLGWCHQANKDKGPAVQRIRKFLMYLHSYFSKKIAVLHLSMTSRWCQKAIKGRHGWISRLACAWMLGRWVWCPDYLNTTWTGNEHHHGQNTELATATRTRVQRASRHVGDLIHGFRMAWEEDQRDNNHGWRRDSTTEHTNSSLEAAIRSKTYTR